MRIIVRTLCLSFLILVSGYSCIAKEWRGIIRLRSTRAEVIKSLGNPKHQWNNPEFFEVDIGTVEFQWIDPTCVRKYPVQPLAAITADDIVFQISITLKAPISLKELGFPDRQNVSLNCSGNSADGPWSNCFIWDSDGGLGYATSKDGVTSVSYGATSADFKEWKQNHSACIRVD